VAEPQPEPEPQRDIDLDLGFGSVVARESRQRLLNRDGSFNIHREGLNFWQEFFPYHYFLTLSWPRFLGLISGLYVVVNVGFAFAYVLCGVQALTGFQHDWMSRFWTAFLFSVETIGTIGYGNIIPVTFAASLVMTIESLFGIIAFALVAGIVFARFARPSALIVFSKNAVIAPYQNTKAFMFRVVNQRRTQIVDLHARVLLSRRKQHDNDAREFIPLKLERDSVTFFPLAWTIVHPIDDDSPLKGFRNFDDLRACESEFLILLNGFDETFSQTVHQRSSYRGNEVLWGARFKTMFNPPDPKGSISIDVRKLDDIERVPLPA